MKLLIRVLLLYLIGLHNARIFHFPSNPKRKSRQLMKRSPKKSRKLTEGGSLNILVVRLEDNIGVISEAYDRIEGIPVGNKSDNMPKGTAKAANSEDFIEGLEDIDMSLLSNNRILMEYINHYVLTKNIIDDYDEFCSENKDNEGNHQNDILSFMISHYEHIKLRNHEKDFFKEVEKYNELVKDQLETIAKSANKDNLIAKLRRRLANGTKLIAFVKKYEFFVNHVSDEHHFVDSEFASFGHEEDIDHEHHRMKHKGFKKKTESPFTIVIDKHELEKLKQDQSVKNSLVDNISAEVVKSSTELNKKPNISERDTFINKMEHKVDQIDNGAVNSIIQDGISDQEHLDNSSIQLDNTLNLEQQKRLDQAKASHQGNLTFYEPTQNLNLQNNPDSILSEDEVDIGNESHYSDGLESQIKDKHSELDNLENVPLSGNSVDIPLNLNKNVYEQNELLLSQPQNKANNTVFTGNTHYITNMLNLESNPAADHGKNGLNPQTTNFQILRKPYIEKIDDHGYTNGRIPDLHEQIKGRLTNKIQQFQGEEGEHNKEIMGVFKHLSNLDHGDLQGVMDQNPHVAHFVQPALDIYKQNLAAAGIEDNPDYVEPPKVQRRLSYDVDPSIGNDLRMMQPMNNTFQPYDSRLSLRQLNQPRKLLVNRPKKRRSASYWSKKADKVYKKLLSGRF